MKHSQVMSMCYDHIIKRFQSLLSIRLSLEPLDVDAARLVTELFDEDAVGQCQRKNIGKYIWFNLLLARHVQIITRCGRRRRQPSCFFLSTY